MRIAVASGKGGTGKTTVAVALAESLGRCLYVDCDVEAPNAHIFLDPRIEVREEAEIMVPKVDESKCTACAECSRVCRFNALAALGTTIVVFPELCHGCGACAMVCEPKAITEGSRPIGEMEWGRSGEIDFYHARLRVGEPMSPPLIRRLKNKAFAEGADPAILDCPPGTTCPMIESVRGADYCILVTEPTPFGLHDLEMAAGAVAELGIPSGVIINRADMGYGTVRDYCVEKGMPVLLEIPHSREAASAYAEGKGLIGAMPELGDKLRAIAADIQRKVAA